MASYAADWTESGGLTVLALAYLLVYSLSPWQLTVSLTAGPHTRNRCPVPRQQSLLSKLKSG